MKKLIILLSITLIVILPATCMANESDGLQIHVIDVGKGDAMILHQPGSCSILIDAGQLLYANRVIDKLNQLDVRTLDMVIVSHPHIDHFGGLSDILPEFPTTIFSDNGQEMNRYAMYLEEYKKLKEYQPYRAITSGDELQCGKLKIHVLYPFDSKNLMGLETNNTSLVLMISYESFRLIHMGDLQHKGENILMELNQDLKANIIKIGHHGIKDATSKALLTKVSPDYAVISSSGKCYSLFCEPDEDVLNLLSDLGIPYSRTDQDGNIKIIVNQDGFEVINASKQ